jgi:FAD/FMN-containing dehydrogenase
MQAMATETFISNMRGPVITRTDANYDAVRSLYNGMIDKSPMVIARCTDAADVVTAIKFAQENDLRVAIRGGGHNGPGLGSVDDGLMIDMSMMKGVRVDPATRTVRVGPGCTQGDVDHATHVYGLAVPAGIVSTTGIAGLSLGGGTGYLSRKHGLTIDSICLKRMSYSPTAALSPPTSRRTLISTGACAAAAAILASSRASCSRLIR